MNDSSKAQPDYSTLNVDALKRLPVYRKPPTYRVDGSMGMGCAGDPPGHPSYFLRPVYNQHGNTPANAPQAVITFEGVHYIVLGKDWPHGGDYWGKRETILRKLYRPLPEEHERVQEWIKSLYRHFQHCYADVNAQVKPIQHNGLPETLIYPIPYYERRHFHDDPRFSEEWRAKERAAVDQANAELEAKYAAVCVVENHKAVRMVRSFYPDHAPRLDLIENPELALPVTTWWERLAQRPTPETCPGTGRGYDWQHPVNKTWCQVCGWSAQP